MTMELSSRQNNPESSGRKVYDLVAKKARKLSVIATLFEEEELLVAAFQDYVASIKDLLAVGDIVNRAETELSLRLQLTKFAKELASSIKLANLDMRKLFEIESEGVSQGLLDSFINGIEESVKLAQLLLDIIIKCSDMLDTKKKVESDLKSFRRTSDPLPSPCVSSDNLETEEISHFPSPSIPILRSTKLRMNSSNQSVETESSSENGDFDFRFYSGLSLNRSGTFFDASQEKVQSSISHPKEYHTVQPRSKVNRESLINDRPLSLFDIMSAYNNPSMFDDINHTQDKERNSVETKSVASTVLNDIKKKDNNIENAVDDIFSQILDSLTENLDILSRIQRTKDTDLNIEKTCQVYSANINSLLCLRATFNRFINENSKKDELITNLKVQLNDKELEIESLKASRTSFENRELIPADKSLSVPDAISYSSIYKNLPPSPYSPEQNNSAKLNIEIDDDAKSVETLLNRIEEFQAEKVSPPCLISSNQIQSSRNTTQERSSLPPEGSVSVKIRREIAASQIQKMYRGFICRKAYKHSLIRKLIAKEIFDTEVSYVKGLLTVYKLYVIPLRFKAVLGSPIIPKEKTDTIFYQIKELMTLNHELLSKIESRVLKWNNWQKIGDIFEECSLDLQMYCEYVNNYPLAVATFNEYENTPLFKSFLSEVKSKREKLSLGLLDLLITPIQRVPRYVLMLKELLRHTSENHPDYESLVSAVEKISKVGDLINEKKRESEKMAQLLSLQSKIANLGFRLAEADRVLIYEGELMELNENGRKKARQIYLFNDLIICTQIHRARFAVVDKAECKWSLKLSDCLIKGIDKTTYEAFGIEEDDIMNFSIGFKGMKDKRILQASTQEQYEKWINHIQEAKKVGSRKGRKVDFPLGRKISIRLSDPQEDLEPKSVLTVDHAINILKDNMDSLDNDIRDEGKVLFGLNRVQAFSKTNSKLANKKEESSKLMHKMRQEAEKLNEMILSFEKLQKSSNVSFVDRKDFTKVLKNIHIDERVMIRAYESDKLPFKYNAAIAKHH